MTRVVLWGCGKYGKYAYSMIKNYYKNTFTVVGFADSHPEKISHQIQESNAAGLHPAPEISAVFGYAGLEELNNEGKVDGVIICIVNKEDYQEVEQNISIIGLPIYSLDSTRVFADDISDRKFFLFGNQLKVSVVNDADVVVRPNHNGRALFTYLVAGGYVLWESDRYLTHSQYPSSYPIAYAPGEKADVNVDMACPMLLLGTNVVYGHFMYAVPCKIFAMEEAGYSGKYLLYSTEFARRWVSLLSDVIGLAEDRIVWVDDTEFKTIRVRELYCIESTVDTSRINARLLGGLADKILKSVVDHEEIYPKRLYVERTGTRKLLDCDGIIEQYGFSRIIPERLSLKEQINYFYHADIVLSPHGSNAGGLIFMRPGTHMIETFGSSFVDLFYIEALKQRNIRFHMLVAQNEYYAPSDYDYWITPALLRKTIEDAIDDTENKP